MLELQKAQFPSIAHLLSGIRCDMAFVYSILENKQHGRILVDDLAAPRSAIFWHYCGFSFISGAVDNHAFNRDLYQLLHGVYEQKQQRFFLFVNDTNWNSRIIQLINGSPSIKILERLQFRFNREIFHNCNIALPTGYSLKEIGKTIFETIEGRLVPSFSWHSYEAFSSCGKGYCLLDGENIACNAFATAIGSDTIDIAVETNVQYQQKGLAVPTAAAMIQYCLRSGYVPNWGCDSTNIGSLHTAQSLGFEIDGSHPIYAKA